MDKKHLDKAAGKLLGVLDLHAEGLSVEET
jgi:hypothetical protein